MLLYFPVKCSGCRDALSIKKYYTINLLYHLTIGLPPFPTLSLTKKQKSLASSISFHLCISPFLASSVLESDLKKQPLSSMFQMFSKSSIQLSQPPHPWFYCGFWYIKRLSWYFFLEYHESISNCQTNPHLAQAGLRMTWCS